MRITKEHYARNAAKGRTVRFSLTLDTQHITDEEKARTGLPRIRMDIKGGTLTPEQAKKIFDIIR